MTSDMEGLTAQAAMDKSEKAGLPRVCAHYLCVQWWVGVLYLHSSPDINNLKETQIHVPTKWPFCLGLDATLGTGGKIGKEPDLWFCQHLMCVGEGGSEVKNQVM